MAMNGEPDILFHYTNFGGLNGILQSRKLWATDIRYLNDAHELSYGVSEMADILRQLAESMPELVGDELVKYGTLDAPGEEILDHGDPGALGPAHRAVYAASQTLAALVDSSKPQFPMNWKMSNGYVTCFTEKPDSLGQWRGYAGGDGFALGFKRAALGELTVPCWDYVNGAVDPASDKWFDQPVPPPQQVNYGDYKRDSVLRDATAALKEYISLHDEVVPYVRFSIDIVNIALRICLILKDEAFQEESEWRLIAMQPAMANLSFRSGGHGNGGIVPFTQLVYPVDALVKIVIGPGNAPDLRERALRQMLEIHGFGYNRVDVDHSRIPFRN